MDKPVYYAATEGGEQAFTVTAGALKFGPGSLSELGGDARGLGMTRVALFTDAPGGAGGCPPDSKCGGRRRNPWRWRNKAWKAPGWT